MTRLLISATTLEIAPFLERYRRKPAAYPGLDVLITGVGMLAAAIKLHEWVALKPPALVIQAGVAGSFNPTIKNGTLVVVGRDTIGDLGVEEGGKWRNLSDMGLHDPNEFPYRNGWLQNPWKKLMASTGLPVVKSVTVNRVSTGDFTSTLRKRYKADLETMEGAALHYVCLMQRIPFLQLRSVSNAVGDRDKVNWQMKKAIGSLNKGLEALLHSK